MAEVCRARAMLTSQAFDKLAMTAERLLQKIEAEPALRDPFLVSLLIDGLKLSGVAGLRIPNAERLESDGQHLRGGLHKGAGDSNSSASRR